MSNREALSNAFELATKSVGVGIGTLSEKLVHRTLKYYIEPNDEHHEVKYESFVADIYKDGRITEIQTASYQYIRQKLSRFLADTHVTLVSPIEEIKYITTLFPDGTGVRKKSPRRNRLSEIAIEMYKIKEFIGNEKFTVKLLFLEIEAQRALIQGKTRPRYKKGISYPTEILREATLKYIDDYRIFLPDSLPEKFLAKDYYKAIGARAKFSYYAIKLCEYLGFISAVGKQGNAIIYERKVK